MGSSSWILQIGVPLYLGWRIWLANRMPITDCDEVFNYWEPLHFLLFGKGLQTWEYANEYALRPYAYLLPLKVFLQLFSLEKIQLFQLLRSALAGTMGIAELIWLYALHQRIQNALQVLWIAVILLTSAGMNHAAGALLPSTAVCLGWLLASAAFLSQKPRIFTVVAITTTLCTGWPFGVMVLVPMGLHVLFQNLRLIPFIILVTVAVQGAVMLVDYQHYGKWTMPTLNILMYNAAGGGDELYGVEPLSYYIKNLLLNFNLVSLLWPLAWPVVYFSRNHRDGMVLIILSSMYIWVALVFSRPHKEERFLFPIYPGMVLGAVLAWDGVLNWAGRVVATLSRHKELGRLQRLRLHAVLWVPVILLSLSRTMALAHYYTAPLRIYASIPPGSRVCTCGEWYRFPSSFFLSEDIGFLPSSFGGQLPLPFEKMGSCEGGTNRFNDQNLANPEALSTLDSCDIVVELEGSECIPEDAILLQSESFLNAQETVWWHRMLYWPVLHEQAVEKGQVSYSQYGIFQLAW